MEFDSCVRQDQAILEFDYNFCLWACEQNIVKQTEYPIDFFCMGWEL